MESVLSPVSRRCYTEAMKLLIHILISSVAVFVAARVLPGVAVADFPTAVTVAVVLGLVNAVLKPILSFLTFPLTLMTLGLFSFVVIGGLVELTAHLVPNFHLVNFWRAIAFGLTFSLINALLHVVGL